MHRQQFVLAEGHPLTDGYWVVACGGCGFIYADVGARQSDFDRYYAEQSKYADSATSTGSGSAPQDAQRLRDLAGRISRYVPDRSRRILDIGCANGGLLRALKDLGYVNLVGMDPAPSCADHTHRMAGVVAYAGTITDCPEDLGRFDCVVLSHVLEHVLELGNAIRGLPRLLQPGGSVVVEVPDASRYAEALVAPFQEFNTEHINHFSATTLGTAMAHCGFTCVDRYHDALAAAVLPYPVTGGLFRYAGTQTTAPQPDRALIGQIELYIRRSRVEMARMDAAICKALAGAPELIVWGTGQLTMKLLAETSLRNARIACFIDSNPVNQGRRLIGVPILPPSRCRDFPHPILIASTLHQQAIARQVREELKLPNELILLAEP